MLRFYLLNAASSPLFYSSNGARYPSLWSKFDYHGHSRCHSVSLMRTDTPMRWTTTVTELPTTMPYTSSIPTSMLPLGHNPRTMLILCRVMYLETWKAGQWAQIKADTAFTNNNWYHIGFTLSANGSAEIWLNANKTGMLCRVVGLHLLISSQLLVNWPLWVVKLSPSKDKEISTILEERTTHGFTTTLYTWPLNPKPLQPPIMVKVVGMKSRCGLLCSLALKYLMIIGRMIRELTSM